MSFTLTDTSAQLPRHGAGAADAVAVTARSDRDTSGIAHSRERQNRTIEREPDIELPTR
jgi:hypothetical protein